MLDYSNDQTTMTVRGVILNPLSDTHCQLLRDGLIHARKQGDDWVVDQIGDAATLCQTNGWQLDAFPSSAELILPAFYDSHFHWVQDSVREMPKASLLQWLETYTFPEEARFADPHYAEAKAKLFWQRILATGTIGGFCYSSIHPTALDAAMKYAPDAFRIGNSLMTMNCPHALAQTVAEAIESADYGAATYGQRYCVTPRFAPTTHPDVMSAAAQLALEKGLYQQTHLDETEAEIKWVLGIYKSIEGFEDVAHYTEIYQRCGMLGPRTVMGHAIHLQPAELELLAQTDTAIASCPTSNAPLLDSGLGSGLFNFEQAEAYGIRWALASDIGGGPFLSMFDVMDSFVRQNQNVGNPNATYAKALYRSTVAGAELLGLGERCGNLAPGKRLDFLRCYATPATLAAKDPEELLARLLMQANTRHDFDQFVNSTVVNGQTLFQRTCP